MILGLSILNKKDQVHLLYILLVSLRYNVIIIHKPDNPLYTDAQYNDKIRYSDNLTVTEPSLKR